MESGAVWIKIKKAAWQRIGPAKHLLKFYNIKTLITYEATKVSETLFTNDIKDVSHSFVDLINQFSMVSAIVVASNCNICGLEGNEESHIWLKHVGQTYRQKYRKHVTHGLLHSTPSTAHLRDSNIDPVESSSHANINMEMKENRFSNQSIYELFRRGTVCCPWKCPGNSAPKTCG